MLVCRDMELGVPPTAPTISGVMAASLSCRCCFIRRSKKNIKTPAMSETPSATPIANPATAPLVNPFDEGSTEAPCPRGELSAVGEADDEIMMVDTCV